MFPGQCGNTAFFFKSQPDQFHFEFRGIVFPGKSFFSAHEVSTCEISGCLSYRILDSGPDGTQTTLTINRGNSEKTLSVTSSKLTDKNGKPMGVRLKGGMFEKGFDGLRFRSHNKEWEQAVYDHRTNKNERKQLDEKNLATGDLLPVD